MSICVVLTDVICGLIAHLLSYSIISRGWHQIVKKTTVKTSRKMLSNLAQGELVVLADFAIHC